MNSPLLLTGIKVVEMGQAIAGPFVGTVFADLGADVIKIEAPGGDSARTWGPPNVDGSASVFHYINRNKTSITLDVRDPNDRRLFDKLIEEADVFVHNLRPGVAPKLGIDAETLRALNPRLIHGDVAAFGHVGPLKDRPGYELALQAYGGVLSVTGTPEAGPMRAGPSIMDFGTAMWMTIAVLAALMRRQATGEGCALQGSLLETAMSWMGIHLSNFVVDGKLPIPFGAGHQLVSPYGAFEASDGPIIIATGNDGLFVKLAAALGHPEWPQDPRFETNSKRTENRAAIDALISEIVATRDKAHWIELLGNQQVPCVPIQNSADLMADEQVAAIGIMQPEPGSDVPYVGMPFSVDGVRPPIKKAPSTLDEAARVKDEVEQAIAAGESPFERLFR
ncbi:MAG: CoA transferase [Rhodospirillaceae bacterium]|jgi:crotonobetainyl-CoA:carnitine CoA-transferase CaiB-like acyl-CoA transferase|nr:CoA transferase [Rhodospirillaceae bacterium]